MDVTQKSQHIIQDRQTKKLWMPRVDDFGDLPTTICPMERASDLTKNGGEKIWLFG